MKNLKNLPVKIVLFSIISASFFPGCTKDADLNPPTANAGPSKAIQLPTSTVTLNGTGSSENGSISAYLWSQVSGPTFALMVSPGSANTAINNLVTGTYIFQLMVIDGVGLTGVDTTSVVVSGAVQQTITLQPGNSTANELNFAVINGNNASAHDIDLDAQAWTSSGNPFFIRGAFKFDLSGIPPSATIINAKLSLYSNPTPINGNRTDANSGSNNSMFIRRISSNWDGNTATWTTQPTTTTVDQLSIPHTALSFLDLVDMDVTALVTTMRASGNFGFMMMLQNETPLTARQFCSSNHSVTAKRPKLVVIYQ